MIFKINYNDKNKSIYKCDKCKSLIYKQDLYKLVFNNKTHHLCKKHAIILKRWLDNIGK